MRLLLIARHGRCADFARQALASAVCAGCFGDGGARRTVGRQVRERFCPWEIKKTKHSKCCPALKMALIGHWWRGWRGPLFSSELDPANKTRHQKAGMETIAGPDCPSHQKRVKVAYHDTERTQDPPTARRSLDSSSLPASHFVRNTASSGAFY